MPPSTTIDSDSSDQLRKSNHAIQLQTLAVGPWQNREFHLAKSDLAQATSWQEVPDLNQAIQLVTTLDSPPELVLLAQPWQGYFEQEQVNRLQSLAPLTRIVVVAGSWSEGGNRSGPRLTGVLRLYWHEFPSWSSAALRRLNAGLCPPWSFPLESPLAGRFIPDSSSHHSSLTDPVAIHAADFTVFETLTAALATAAITTLWIQPDSDLSIHQELSAGIWDGSQLGTTELNQLREFCNHRALHQTNVVALLDYPRPEHLAQARDAGASAVFGKPYVVEELIAALE